MGDMADWHVEQMCMPCEFCGKIHMNAKDEDDCEFEWDEEE